MAKARWSVLDTVFVLMSSVTLSLVTFWLAAQFGGTDSFNVLPGWMSTASDKLWVFLTTGAASAVLYWIKGKGRAQGQNPVYPFWIVMFTLFFVAIPLSVALLAPKHGVKNNSVLWITLQPDSLSTDAKSEDLIAMYKANMNDDYDTIAVKEDQGGGLRIAFVGLKVSEIHEILIRDKKSNRRWSQKHVPLFNVYADLYIKNK